MAGRSGDASARMGARAAQIEAGKGHAVIGMAKHRARREKLVEADLAVEDVTPDEAEAALEVERRQGDPAEHGSGEAGRVGIDGGDDMVGGLLAARIPAAFDLVGEMLAEQA